MMGLFPRNLTAIYTTTQHAMGLNSLVRYFCHDSSRQTAQAPQRMNRFTPFHLATRVCFQKDNALHGFGMLNYTALDPYESAVSRNAAHIHHVRQNSSALMDD
jgi:hypothetical protein